MQLCSKCIIPDTFPGVTFEDSICGFCRVEGSMNKINKDLLGKDALIEKIQSKKSGKYDCGVPFSGGKDSSYVLYYLSKKLGLKCLALFFDNGFINEMARENVRKICKQMDADLIIGHATTWRRKLVDEALHTSKDLGRFVRICGNCENNLRSFTINEAVNNDVPILVWGSTDYEESAAYYIDPKMVAHRKRHGRIGTLSRRAKKALGTLLGGRGKGSSLRAGYHGAKSLYYGVRDNIAQKAPEGLRIYNPFLEVSFIDKGVESITIFDYLEYDPQNMIKLLREEVDWKAPADKEARMDCMIHAVANYQHLASTGITRDGFTLSVLVRNGLISREEALKKEEAMKRDIIEECREFLDETGIDTGDLLPDTL